MKNKHKNIIAVLIFMFVLIVLMFSAISIFHAYKFTHTKKSISGFRPKSMELSFKDTLITTFVGVNPKKKFENRSPSDYGLMYENVSFRSRDGIILRGWFVEANNPKGTIMLLHGWGNGKEGLLNYSKFLNVNKYNALLFDFRGFGESDGNYTTLGYYERLDVLGAVDYLKTRNDVKSNKMGALGFSMGGGALVMAAKEQNDFKAIVLDSTYTTIHQNVARRFKVVYGFPKFPFATSLTFFGGLINGFNAFDLAPVKYINKVNTSILIIQGTNDSQVSVEDALELYEKANEPKRIWIVEGSKHTESYTMNNTEYRKRVIEFFDTYIK